MVNDSFQQRLRRALETATTELLAERNARGFWGGELSSSALSTATAVMALAVARREVQISKFQSQIDSGLRWLAEHQNADGGWGVSDHRRFASSDCTSGRFKNCPGVTTRTRS